MSAPDLKAPPAKPGMWTWRETVNGLEVGLSVGIKAKTWFEARAKACTFFGCEPGDVVCVGRPV